MLDKANRLWLGTRRAGFFCDDGVEGKKVETSQQTILDLHEDHENGIWVGTRAQNCQQPRAGLHLVYDPTSGLYAAAVET
jgi:ligand-binding sensor domain-containing protein